ncbi:MAG TPA: IPT/TIG domain-containing protein [Candidatus Acidoferrales bacterium]|nr:IPT/TIG domain-containing protein [Candidatus Acidoferrales bacterium]
MKGLMALATGAAVTPACTGFASLLGQQLYPADYPWNQNISQAPVATNSAAFIARIGGTKPVHPDWGEDSATNGTSPLYGIPYNVVHGNSTAKINVTIDNYPGQSDIVPVPIPANAVIEGDYQNGPNSYGAGYDANQRGDSHLIVWDEDNNVGYELYGATRPSDTNTFDEVPNNGQWHAAQESVWNFNSNSFRPLGWTSADAAGLSILAGLARPEEGLPVSQGGQGAINHALRMTLPANVVSQQYIYPASHMVSESGIVPLGTRLRLKNTTAVNNLIAAMGPQSQIIARAMQQYGLILADVGSAMFVTGASASGNATNAISLTWNMSDVLDLKTLTATNFDVVSLKPMVSGLSAANGPPGSPLTINGQNFSGAAGNLSVFFGGIAAGPVDVLSDTQLSLTVPGGSGTLNVTVQSGTNETDTVSDSPGANVNAPIFGYGISALTNADKFTFAAASPTIQHVAFSGQNLLFSGTNNTGPGGTYHVLTATNLLLPRTNWTVLTNRSFDASGNFAFTNAIATTNAQLFYILRVP